MAPRPRSGPLLPAHPNGPRPCRRATEGRPPAPGWFPWLGVAAAVEISKVGAAWRTRTGCPQTAGVFRTPTLARIAVGPQERRPSLGAPEGPLLEIVPQSPANPRRRPPMIAAKSECRAASPWAARPQNPAADGPALTVWLAWCSDTPLRASQ
eukprot:scaffold10848_cov57-Phaeocystis_antarctica.AAC.11